MFGEGLVDAPFAVPNSLFRFVEGTAHLLRGRWAFCQISDTIDGCLATERAVRALPVVVELPLLNSLIDRVLRRRTIRPGFVDVSEL